MNDQPQTATAQTDQWADRTLTPAQQQNRDSAALIPVSRAGAMPMDFAQMVDYAKFMSGARGAVGSHLIQNVGACLAIMEIAKQFDMPAYAVARQSYFVNGRIAFMGQFVHAILNKYCPTEKKLTWRYKGEGDDLQIIISGKFPDEVDAREWESPKLKDITVKNSPLWKSNPKHQLIYFGVRAWQTVHWPEGMLGIHTDDEASMLPMPEVGADNARLVGGDTPGADLRGRLRAHADALPEGEKQDGFQEGFTEGHFTEVDENKAAEISSEIDKGIEAATGAVGHVEPDKPEEKPAEPVKGDEPEGGKARKSRKKADQKAAPQPEAAPPKTVAEWSAYSLAWIQTGTDADALRERWAAEQKLRNTIGVTSEDRDPVFEAYQNRLIELEGE
jgi:hypothetical protein